MATEADKLFRPSVLGIINSISCPHPKMSESHSLCSVFLISDWTYCKCGADTVITVTFIYHKYQSIRLSTSDSCSSLFPGETAFGSQMFFSASSFEACGKKQWICFHSFLWLFWGQHNVGLGPRSHAGRVDNVRGEKWIQVEQYVISKKFWIGP